jgi:hypothetical protein
MIWSPNPCGRLGMRMLGSLARLAFGCLGWHPWCSLRLPIRRRRACAETDFVPRRALRDWDAPEMVWCCGRASATTIRPDAARYGSGTRAVAAQLNWPPINEGFER